MLVYKRINDLKTYIVAQKAKNLSIGFTPTMGALHEGHMSLIQKSVKENDITICCIFVNPTQFNEKSDLEEYPITINEDVRLLVENKNTVLFLPSVEEIYPDKNLEYKLPFDFGKILDLHEGEFRPGHFEGMIQVVHRLLDIVTPHKIYMGQKDYQQAMIINRLIEGCNIETKLVVCPIKREKSGLAMSSRNRRLTKEAKETATIISKTLKWANENSSQYTIEEIENKAIEKIKSKGFKIDYFHIANAKNLESITNNEEKKVALVAAWIEGIRLIDNLVFDVD